MILIRFAAKTLTKSICHRIANKSPCVHSLFLNGPATTNIRSFTSRGGIHGHNPSNVKEIEIPVSYGKIAAKAWGSESAFPVLVLHCWLSNCDSFSKLIPLLSDQFYFVAVDLPGNGKSSHHPPGLLYNDTSTVLDCKRITDHLGWNKFHVMGHCLGASHAFLFSSLFPDSVDKLVSIEAVRAFSLSADKIADLKVKAAPQLLEIEKSLRGPPSVYDKQAVIEKIIKNSEGDMNEEGARIMMMRDVVPSGQGFVFRRDPRVYCLPYLDAISDELAMSLVPYVRCKLLIVLANGLKRSPRILTPELEVQVIAMHKHNLENLSSFVLEYVDGNHYVHLHNPELVAPLINKFLLNDY